MMMIIIIYRADDGFLLIFKQGVRQS